MGGGGGHRQCCKYLQGGELALTELRIALPVNGQGEGRGGSAACTCRVADTG